MSPAILLTLTYKLNNVCNADIFYIRGTNLKRVRKSEARAQKSFTVIIIPQDIVFVKSFLTNFFYILYFMLIRIRLCKNALIAKYFQNGNSNMC
jgi:hypothetical protein